ncbi:hypothetical protein LCGC14_0632220 [marine sediment metagenome]|uniref:RNA polymerase sigma-70 region 4 domain-containing protein n=1 Tax=marine sediment metagenome TaxID=412755 RepID=A0A0F9RL21_9ZZZZ
MAYRKIKPMPHEKGERNRDMLRYQDTHPKATFQDIGLEFKISGSRAYQIITRERKRLAATV